MKLLFFRKCPAGMGLVATILMVGTAGAQEKPLGQGKTTGLSSRIAFIIGKSPSVPAPAGERHTALRRLTPAIPASDSASLLTFVASPAPVEFTSPLWQVLVNDTFDLLLRHPNPPAQLGSVLVQFAGEQDDPVLRDYALQKLDKLAKINHLTGAGKEILPALKKAAAQHGTHFQGTALLTWQRAVAEYPEDFDLSALKSAVLTCLNDSTASGPAKAAALQVAALLGMKEAAPAARALLRLPESTVNVRISALHALGALGGKDDTALIRQYSVVLGCEAAAEAALQKL